MARRTTHHRLTIEQPMKAKQRLVYSTDTGRLCPECLRPKTDCKCGRSKKHASAAVGDTVYIRRETKGRKGAGVTLITELPLEPADLKSMAKSLKKMCGVGGSVKDGVIEIQGDQRAKIKEALEKQGLKVKLAGG